jgi:hypothetical protein
LREEISNHRLRFVSRTSASSFWEAPELAASHAGGREPLAQLCDSRPISIDQLTDEFHTANDIEPPI